MSVERVTMMEPTTPEQQTAALDVLVRAALTDFTGPLSSELQTMLSTLPRDTGLRVASVLVMLAGMAVADTADWRALLAEHMAGADQED